MTRAAPHIPVVVLTDPFEQPAPPPLTEPARLAAGGAVAALDELASACGEVCRAAALIGPLTAAAAAAGALAREVAHATPAVDAEAIPVRAPNHIYFGVRGSGPDARFLSPAQAAVFETTICYWVLADLRHAMIDINDLAAEVAALRMVLASLLTGQDETVPSGSGETVQSGPEYAGAARTPVPGGPPGGFEPDGDGLDRWIVAHHAYFMFNIRAAAAAVAAVHATAAGRDGLAARSLRAASCYVRGFTGAMAHAAALPAAYYQRIVRPTMAPPAVPRELTGRTQPEHRAFRTALDKLLTALPEPYGTLSASRPALAAARAELLDRDLADIERHAAVAGALVGSDHSLVQPEGSGDNAVATLRLMRHLRAARYCSLTRFGDRFAVGEGRPE
jgi:hypothetical protein